MSPRKMLPNNKSPRIVIALTESSPVTDVWEAAMQVWRELSAELTVVFFHDERWQRAASLPFTREYPLIGGAAVDFTLSRAERLLADTAANLRHSVEELAGRAGLSVAFQVIPSSDQGSARELFTADVIAVVGPSSIARNPAIVALQGSELRVVLIEAPGAGSGAG